VLRWLGLRELSTSQARLRLRRRHFPDEVVETTLAALAGDGLLDDGRAARARARHDATIKRRGPGRVLRAVQALGVDRETARDAVAAAFADVDQDAMLDAAIDRRLRGQPIPTDPRAGARLSTWLIRQGHDAERVYARLRRR
jgi:SOS response regulatory protein OraA/RecX